MLFCIGRDSGDRLLLQLLHIIDCPHRGTAVEVQGRQIAHCLARQVVVACKDRGMCLARQVVVTCKDRGMCLARQVIVACKDRGMCLARQVVVTGKDGMLSLRRMFVLACHNSLDRL